MSTPLDSTAFATALFDQSPFSSVIYDAAGRPVAVNAAFTALMGLQLSDVPDDYSVLHDPQLAAQGALDDVARAFAGERVTLPPVRYDAAIYGESGRVTWTQAQLYPIRAPDGELTHVVLVHVDLTQRIEAEDALRASQAELTGERLRLEAILNAVSDGITVQVPGGDIVYANNAAARVLGFLSGEALIRARPSEVRGRFEIYDELGQPMRMEDLPGRRALAGADVAEAILRYRLIASGTEHWSLVRARALRDEDGAVAFVVNAFHDITDEVRQRHEMEAARNAALWAEQRASFLAEAGALLASSLDYETTLKRIAWLAVPRIADWCTMHLIDGDDVRRIEVAHRDPVKLAIARELEERYPQDPSTSGVHRVVRTRQPELYPDIPEELLMQVAVDDEHLQRIRQLGLRSAMIVPLVAHDHTLGALTLISAESGRRYGPADLQFAGALATRAALAVNTARLYHEAQEANRAKSQFLAVMSHELRTPLNAILGYADLLGAGVSGPLTTGQQEHLERIGQGARHLTDLIETVLAFARIEAGTAELRIESTSLRELVEDAVALVAPAAAKKGIELETRIEDDVVVRTDVGRTRQILLNLLSNAVKFTDEGWIRTTVRRAERQAAIDVEDTGIGIDAADIDRMWEPFTQLDASLTRRTGGTGLGLPVSRALADALGGSLAVESKPGVGSRFTLFLPL